MIVAQETEDVEVLEPSVANQLFNHSSERMSELPDNSIALMITSPPYHVGKEYDSDDSFEHYLKMLERVFRETHRVLQPGGRAVINVANLGRRPYIPLSHEVTAMMLKIGYLMRAEIIWAKAKGAGSNCRWIAGARPLIPLLEMYTNTVSVFPRSDLTER